jgi:hypothetical protein
MMTIEKLRDLPESPWAKYASWHGKMESSDGTTVGPVPTPDDVDEVIAYNDNFSQWDGECAFVARLKDGRYISWESWTDCTGSGFSCDAYGGDAIVWFSLTITEAISLMSERALELIRSQIEALPHD